MDCTSVFRLVGYEIFVSQVSCAELDGSHVPQQPHTSFPRWPPTWPTGWFGSGCLFAEAHEIAVAAVRYCESRGLELSELSAEQLDEISPALTPEVMAVLTVTGSIASRDGRGGTAPTQVQQQLAEVLGGIEAINRWVADLEDGSGPRDRPDGRAVVQPRPVGRRPGPTSPRSRATPG